MKLVSLLWSGLWAVAFTLSVQAQEVGYRYVFSPLAGRRLLSNVDGPAGLAGFATPVGVAADKDGNLYVADFSNDTIRKISAAGVVSTLAGSPGVAGSADGNGGAACFNLPFGVAVDQSGNVFVADTHNHTIRRITPAGAVTTWAGAAGVAGSADGDRLTARFNLPVGVAVSRTGIVYVADFENNTVRAISPSGLVTTLAGQVGIEGDANGSGSEARFTYPTGVAVDGAGNVYLADPETSLRRITPAGDVTTVPGLAAGSGPNGVAVDGDGNIYVSEIYSATVSRISGSGAVTTVAGVSGLRGYANGTGEAARFSFPYNVTVDGAGNAYVADEYNATIRKVTPSGTVTTVAGQGPSVGSADGIGAAAQFDLPQGIAVDLTGSVYVADTFNSTIRKIGPGGMVTTLAGVAGQDGHDDGTGAAARFGFPTGVATDRAGNVYVADFGNHTVRKIAPGGAVTTLAGAAGQSGSADGAGAAARFNLPNGVVVDASGILFVADLGNSTIRKITPAGQVTTMAGTAGQPGGVDGLGRAARFIKPAGLAMDGAGNLYVSDRGDFTIRKIAPDGAVSTLVGLHGVAGHADGAGSAAQFSYAGGIAIDRLGVLYVADGEDRVRKVTPAGVVTTVNGNAGPYGQSDAIEGVSVGQVFFASNVAVDTAGNLYVMDTGNNTIRVGVLTIPTASIGTASPTGVPTSGDTATLSAIGAGLGVTYQWQRNGSALSGATSATLALANIQPATVGLYTYVIAGSGSGGTSDPAILGVSTTSKVIGAGAEVGHGIVHPNGHVFDQVLLSGAAATVTAEPGKTTRISFVDATDDIVQVEFSGAGTLSLLLDDASGPAPAANYNQPDVSYMKGHAGIVITGADDTTNVAVFSVGPVTAVNPALFKGGVTYDGMADLAFVAIQSTNGKFGGVRTANASYYATQGLTGVYAPGVQFTGPVYVGDINASGAATPVLILGSAMSDTWITGGDLQQVNGQPVKVSGVAQLKFMAGSTSHGVADRPARSNQAVLMQHGVDVTAQIVANPTAASP